MARWRHFRNLARTLAVIILAVSTLAAKHKNANLPAPNLTNELSALNIPRLQSSPRLEDFEGMEASSILAKKMLKIAKFTQKEPRDGQPSSQRTEAYLGYTGKSFYAVFLAFDSEPRKLRARMLRRELIDDDDQVGMLLDTFHDHRHAYFFIRTHTAFSRMASGQKATGQTAHLIQSGTPPPKSTAAATW